LRYAGSDRSAFFKIDWAQLAKANIKELFFRERSLHLPIPWPGHAGFAVSERAMRLLIMVLTGLFLLTLATALGSQLLRNRAQHVIDESRLTLLHADRAAQAISLQLLQESLSGKTLSGLSQSLLADVVKPDATEGNRNFLLLNGDGNIIASLPEQKALQGVSVATVMGPNFVTDASVNAQNMLPTSLASGEEIFVASRFPFGAMV
jgi:hypothetical protein